MLTTVTARELTLDAAQSARSYRAGSKNLSPTQIKKLLDSRNDRDILEGLRKVISVCVQRVNPCSYRYWPALRLGRCSKNRVIAEVSTDDS